MWIKLKRERVSRTNNESICIRNNRTICFSSPVVKKLNLTIGMYATFYTNEQEDKIMVSFTRQRKDDDSYLISNDGGKKGTREVSSLIIQSTSIIKKISKFKLYSNKKRDIEVQIKDNCLYFDLIPCFENTDMNLINEFSTGIYRLLKKNEVVYIGKGKIKNRTISHKKNGLEFDKIEYSIIDSDEDCFKWESYHIEEYYNQNNRLPSYNKIKGIKID
jgi:hypothetical protein